MLHDILGGRKRFLEAHLTINQVTTNDPNDLHLRQGVKQILIKTKTSVDLEGGVNQFSREDETSIFDFLAWDQQTKGKQGQSTGPKLKGTSTAMMVRTEEENRHS